MEEMNIDKCGEIMTHHPECCVGEDIVNVAVDIMRDMNCGAVPVVDSHENGKAVGIVTDRDICLYIGQNDICPSNVSVRDCMTVNLVTCSPDDSIDAALNLMKSYKIRRIPILNDNSQIVGIIAQSDIATRSNEKPYDVYKYLEKVSMP
ncbi:MAG: CBS domain-containing protein [Desulfomicrobium escambiense]|nr:CBS domain-containing protein [Desulfomicrobium escambiense]